MVFGREGHVPPPPRAQGHRTRPREPALGVPEARTTAQLPPEVEWPWRSRSAGAQAWGRFGDARRDARLPVNTLPLEGDALFLVKATRARPSCPTRKGQSRRGCREPPRTGRPAGRSLRAGVPPQGRRRPGSVGLGGARRGRPNTTRPAQGGRGWRPGAVTGGAVGGGPSSPPAHFFLSGCGLHPLDSPMHHYLSAGPCAAWPLPVRARDTPVRGPGEPTTEQRRRLWRVWGHAAGQRPHRTQAGPTCPRSLSLAAVPVLGWPPPRGALGLPPGQPAPAEKGLQLGLQVTLGSWRLAAWEPHGTGAQVARRRRVALGFPWGL